MTSFRPTALRASLTVAMLLALPATAAAFDNLNDATLGDPPWTSASTFTGTTPVFDNSAYTLESGESGAPTVYLGCGSWGSKTAWVRFRTGVAGNARVFVDSSIPGPGGHDVFYKVYTAPGSIVPGQAGYDDLTDVDCFNGNNGLPDEEYFFGYTIPANSWIYVQVLSLCRSGEALPYCSPQEQADAPGGNTTINLRFTPQNADGDAVPDTLDNCPTVPNSDQGNQDGDSFGDACDTDRDGDGHDNTRDNCPAVSNAGQENQDADSLGDVCDADRDGDGWVDGLDCAPTDPGMNPDARDKRGNTIDENCDDRLEPYRRVRNGITPDTLVLSGTNTVRTWARFRIGGVRPRMRVRIECDGGRCPYSRKTYRVRRRAASFAVGREFRNRVQLVGTEVTIKILRPGFMGRVVRYTIRRRGRPKTFKGCIPKPNKPRPVRRRCLGIAGR